MNATFIHDGDSLDFRPVIDYPAGAVVVLADGTIGITRRAIPANNLGALAMRGVFEVPRQAGGIIPMGKRLAWDEANQRATHDLALQGLVPLGIAAAESGDTATTIRVRLNH